MIPLPLIFLLLLSIAIILLLVLRFLPKPPSSASSNLDVGSSMTIGSREIQEDEVGTLATTAGLLAVLADGMGKEFGARIASRTAVGTFLDLFRDYNAILLSQGI